LERRCNHDGPRKAILGNHRWRDAATAGQGIDQGDTQGPPQSADREGTAIAAAHTIEQLLPDLVELNRVWAIGAIKAGAYHEAHATTDQERYHRIPVPWTEDVEAIRETSGARVAECAMGILHGKLRTMARLVEIAPVATMEGLRAKTLAAMYECMPGTADHEGGFDFGTTTSR
jgi:hypothetical protein